METSPAWPESREKLTINCPPGPGTAENREAGAVVSWGPVLGAASRCLCYTQFEDAHREAGAIKGCDP